MLSSSWRSATLRRRPARAEQFHQPEGVLRPAPRSVVMAYLLWVFPGGNHLYLGRRRAALLQIALLVVGPLLTLVLALLADILGNAASAALVTAVTLWALQLGAYALWKILDLLRIPGHVHDWNFAAGADVVRWASDE